MNATISEVDTQFRELLSIKGVYRRLCTSNDPKALKRMYNLVNSTRNTLRKGGMITTELKIKWLMRAGWRPGVEKLYTKREVVAMLDATCRLNKEARAMGGAYVLEHLTRVNQSA